MVELRSATAIAIKNKNLHKSNLSYGPFGYFSPTKLSIDIQSNSNDLTLASFPQEIPTKNKGIGYNRYNINHQLSTISYYSYFGYFLEEIE